MPTFQNEQLKLLRLLGRIHFGSIHLLHALAGGTRKLRSTYSLLHEIERDSGFICHKVFYTQRKQALGTCYALTPAGVDYLAALERWPAGAGYAPRDGIGFEWQDFFHRDHCALFMARFWQWAETTEDVAVRRWSGYWERADKSVYARNRVPVPGLEDGAIIPDWLLTFDHGEKRRLLAVEMDRTTGRMRMLERVRAYAAGIDSQAIAHACQHPKAPFVLLITETEEKMAKLVTDVRAGKAGATFVRDFLANFHLTTVPDLEARGIDKAFYRFDGSPSALFAG